MRNLFSIPALAFAGAAVLLAGCEYSPGTADRTIAFNRSVAESTNQLFLLNAVRASKRNPTFYSRLTANTATGTATPGLSSTIPWEATKAITTGTTLSSVGAPAVVTAGSSLSRVLTKNPLSLMPGLSLTETNQLTLSNSDDQASTTGIMTPVSLQLLSYFRSEGFNLEELGLLFFGSVTISNDQIEALKAATGCSIDCTNMAACESGANANSIIFPNDPARFERTAARAAIPAQQVYKGFRCFHDVLYALIRLGLAPQTKSSHTFLYSVPENLALHNARYLADLTQQGFELGADGTTIAVCKKSDDTILQIAALPDSINPHGLLAKRLGLGPGSSSASVHPDQASPTFSGSASVTVAVSPNPAIAGPATPRDPCLAAMIAAGKPDSPKGAVPISFSQRSLEAMVYFLGQIIRRDHDCEVATGHGCEVAATDDSGRFSDVAFSISSDPRYSYREALFRVRNGTPSTDALVQVTSDGDTYYVPALCEEESNCSEEYPDHASAQVLTMLNQIWNLQKVATPIPVVPTVTVVTPP